MSFSKQKVAMIRVKAMKNWAGQQYDYTTSQKFYRESFENEKQSDFTHCLRT